MAENWVWVITQLVVVIYYRRFVTICRSYLQGILGFEYGTDRLSRNVDNKLPLLPTLLVTRA